MRIAVDQRRIELDPGHHRPRLGLPRSAAQFRAVDPERLGDRIADGHPRVEAGQRVLEDDLQVLARRAQRLSLRMGDVAAHQGHRAGGRRDQVQHRPRQRRLARAALADHAQRLALAHHERDAVHRAQHLRPADQAVADREVDLHVAPLDQHRRIGRQRRDRRPPAAVVAVQPRDRVQQGARVGGLRVGKDLGDRAFLDVGAVLHHADPVGQPGDDAHVVGDQRQRRAGLPLQLGHQVEDLGLHRHVQRRRRLVGDQQFRSRRERRRDHHPLAHAAGELVRILPQPPRRVGDPHPVQPLARPRLRRVPRKPQVQPQRLGDLLTDLHVRGQRRQRVLEDHGHLRAADAVEVPRLQPKQLLPVQLRRSRSPAVAGQQPHHRQEGLALARPALADHAQRLAALDIQRDAAHGADHAIVGVEIDGEVLQGKDGRHRPRP